MRILVIGCGSIGRRHIRLLREMGVEVCGYDADPLICKQVASEFEVPVYDDLDNVWDADADGVVIATPTHLHLQSVAEAFEQWERRGLLTVVGVLVEKPLAQDVGSAEELLKTVTVGGLLQTPVLVGYNLRFHPGLRRVKELLDSGAIGTVRCARLHFGSYLPGWRPGHDHRKGYAASRICGGGVILDASHELDYACWLFGEPVSVSCVAQNTGALEIETEDVADLTVTFASGVQANIHLDYLNRQRERGCEIVGDRETIECDLVSNTFTTPIGGGMTWVRTPLHYDETTGELRYTDPDDMYRAELRHFLACLRGEEQPLCTGEDGLRALRLALAARESGETGRVVRL